MSALQAIWNQPVGDMLGSSAIKPSLIRCCPAETHYLIFDKIVKTPEQPITALTDEQDTRAAGDPTCTG
ncbi:uncharacterized protein RMCT_2171 [Mycolicibacterium thermoresistibile]|uniref:Uncharacterized protein n=1 Tax=Mycolicibacterium thermoresistibile TaxID=1797 RepID=A0A124E8B5_MYCTH|nr:uncharacterized protein RMCT_2171 [Mycolicibacterium thermoresistibile]